VPALILAASLWGVGLGGGYMLAFDVMQATPPSLTGASGYWAASTAGLLLAGFSLTFFLVHVLRRMIGPRLNTAPS
ncbi:MAG: hypothetical protein Q8N44_17315, partial [Rubrivivax sp.]|nr:hypothetical protein [Rubrivivax sp.]